MTTREAAEMTEAFAGAFREALKARGMSMAEAARQLGTNEKSVRNWAGGRDLPNLLSLLRICDLLDWHPPFPFPTEADAGIGYFPQVRVHVPFWRSPDAGERSNEQNRARAA